MRAGVNIVLFTVVLPLIINFLLAKTHAATRDLWIGQVSIVLMTVGVFIIAAAGTAAFLIVGKYRISGKVTLAWQRSLTLLKDLWYTHLERGFRPLFAVSSRS